MVYSEPIVRIIPMITEDLLVSIGLARGTLTKKLAGEGIESADIYLRSPFRSWDDKNIVGTVLLRAFATVSARQQVMARTPLVWEEYQERAGGMVVDPRLAREGTQDELACARLIHLALIGKEINITGQYGVRCGEYGGIDDGDPPNLKRASVVFFNSEGLTEGKTSYVTKLSRMQDIMVNSRRVTVSGDKWGRGDKWGGDVPVIGEGSPIGTDRLDEFSKMHPTTLYNEGGMLVRNYTASTNPSSVVRGIRKLRVAIAKTNSAGIMARALVSLAEGCVQFGRLEEARGYLTQARGAMGGIDKLVDETIGELPPAIVALEEVIAAWPKYPTLTTFRQERKEREDAKKEAELKEMEKQKFRIRGILSQSIFGGSQPLSSRESEAEYVDVGMSESVNVPMSEYVGVEDKYVDEGMGEYVDVGGIMGDLGASSDIYFINGVPASIKEWRASERARAGMAPKTKAPPKPPARTSKGKKQAPTAPPAEPKKERSGYLGRVFSFDLDD